MQNSTQWCNLYLTESKCNITINPSKTRQIILWICSVLIFVLFFYIFYLNGKIYLSITNELTLILLVLTCLFNSGCIVYFYLFIDSKNSKISQFVLHNSGLIDCELNSNLVIQGNSRVGWFGCWLKLTNNLTHELTHDLKNEAQNLNSQKVHQKTYISELKSNKTFNVFIFKDSLSKQDYSRLSRQILSKHREKPENKTSS